MDHNIMLGVRDCRTTHLAGNPRAIDDQADYDHRNADSPHSIKELLLSLRIANTQYAASALYIAQELRLADCRAPERSHELRRLLPLDAPKLVLFCHALVSFVHVLY